MRLIWVLLVGMLLAQPVWAEWTKIDFIDREADGLFAGNFTVYVNYASIRKSNNGQTRIMWFLWDYEYPQKLWNKVDYKSTTFLDEYDCERKQYRDIGSFYYSERMGGGQIVHKSSSIENSWGRNWAEAPAGTPGGNILKAACNRPLPK
jgi:hypothetical protein